MSNQEINERVALALGWIRLSYGYWRGPTGIETPYARTYASIRDTTGEIIEYIDARRPAMSVAFLNAMRDVLAPRMPKNKAGSPVITDWDLFAATPREICEAFLKVVEKGKKQ